MTSTARAVSSRSKSARSLASTTDADADDDDGVEMDDARCARASVPRATHAMATHAMDAIRSAREGVGRADATGARDVSPARMLDAGRGRNCRATRETRRERRLVVSASERE